MNYMLIYEYNNLQTYSNVLKMKYNEGIKYVYKKSECRKVTQTNVLLKVQMSIFKKCSTTNKVIACCHSIHPVETVFSISILAFTTSFLQFKTHFYIPL